GEAGDNAALALNLEGLILVNQQHLSVKDMDDIGIVKVAADTRDIAVDAAGKVEREFDVHAVVGVVLNDIPGKVNAVAAVWVGAIVERHRVGADGLALIVMDVVIHDGNVAGALNGPVWIGLIIVAVDGNSRAIEKVAELRAGKRLADIGIGDANLLDNAAD